MNTQEHTVTFTPEAIKTIEAMKWRVAEIAVGFGENSKEYHDASWSLIHSLTQMISLGGRIGKDDDLSLYGTSFISYGVIWFGKRQADGTRGTEGEWSVHS